MAYGNCEMTAIFNHYEFTVELDLDDLLNEWKSYKVRFHFNLPKTSAAQHSNLNYSESKCEYQFQYTYLKSHIGQGGFNWKGLLRQCVELSDDFRNLNKVAAIRKYK